MKRIVPFISLVILISLSACNLTKRNNGIKEAAVIPQDREAIRQLENMKTFKPEELSKGKIEGDWSIEEVMGKEAVGEKAPFLKFADTPQGKKMYGNNGCNTLNAGYTYNPQDSTLQFDNVLTTMMLCGKPGITDQEITQAVNNTRYYNVSENEDYNYLKLYDENHNLLMVLMHQNFNFLNGKWKVVKIDDQPINVAEMVLVFDVDEKKVHGNTGCNVMNGSFETDMDTPNSISFSNLAVTMMMCPDIEAERALLIALEDANRAKPISKTEVQLLNSDNKVVLTLKKV